MSLGTEDDGYICSSNRIRNAYRRRPTDFKRRILSRITENRSDLLKEEFKYLLLIKDQELGKRYYNLNKHRYGHWTEKEISRLSVGKKISASPNRGANISKANTGKTHSEETKMKISKLKTGKKLTKKQKELRNEKMKNKKSINIYT